MAVDLVLVDAARPFTQAAWPLAEEASPRPPRSAGGRGGSRWRASLPEALSSGLVRVGDAVARAVEDRSEGPVIVSELDRPEQVAAVLRATAERRPLVLLDAGWPRAWRRRTLEQLPRSGPPRGAALASELGPDGRPRLTVVTNAAQLHAVRHACALVSAGPGQVVVVAGLPPAIAWWHGVVPALVSGAHVVVVPGDVARLLDVVAWDSPSTAVVDERRAQAMRREGWDAQTRILVPGHGRGGAGLAGPGALGFAATLADEGRVTLVPPTRLAQAADRRAVGFLALSRTVSDTRARVFSDGGLELAADTAPRLSPSELLRGRHLGSRRRTL